ncbi:alpha-galactosidase [Streptomyces sp. NBC_00237]|uniref:glycoside hydrolase family 36 protein n=1 Tax=Streptomyces sp. NBC_00237 TaxID=2975687 RepID=UPI00225AD93B|nr:glycoside hydrolase family 36 protein [Streptomyces sp. NBC_00237]MCX5205118.1 alpha-galactosidase [Streptomyces sp. NBC_00237]
MPAESESPGPGSPGPGSLGPESPGSESAESRSAAPPPAASDGVEPEGVTPWPVPAWRPGLPDGGASGAGDPGGQLPLHTGLFHSTGDPLVVHLRLSGGTREQLETTVTPDGEGAVLIEVTVAAEAPTAPATSLTVHAEWRVPCVGATAYWTPDTSAPCWLPPSWTLPRTVSLALGAPVASLVGAGDRALCTAALGETSAPVRVGGGVVEESGEFAFTAEQQLDSYGRPLRLRIDLTGRHFAATVQDVAAWWGEGLRHPGVAPAARLPAYSTWYSLHQHVDAAAVERQAALAADLGCASIIVDDGWQTADRTRGYGHCGDWDANPEAFPDPAAHVAEVHRLGLAELLWYAVPYIGRHDDAWDRFKGMLLREEPEVDAAVLDPRHPAVRGHLIEKISKAVEQWGVDGLKLDFIDRFAVKDPPPAPTGADHTAVHEGVRQLLADLDARLRRTCPDVIVELRQPYVSPGLWPYAAMIRATDCPLSPAENRQRTVDCRLTSGPLAVHADMIMWHPAETPENVAVHLINALFSVPQISIDLAAQSPDQLAVVRFWTRVFRTHVDVLQLGSLEPSRPELGYPQVRAHDARATVVARYAPLPVALPERPGPRTVLVANADPDPVVLLTATGPERVLALVRDCRGDILSETVLDLLAGPNPVTVPTGGLLTLTRER